MSNYDLKLVKQYSIHTLRVYKTMFSQNYFIINQSIKKIK